MRKNQQTAGRPGLNFLEFTKANEELGFIDQQRFRLAMLLEFKMKSLLEFQEMKGISRF